MEKYTNVDYEKLAKEKRLQFDEKNCPMTASMKVVGGKWKLIVLNFIRLDSPARFGELKKKIKGISQAMLTTQLRELENDGLVKRKVYAVIPPKVEYTLTEKGKSLLPILKGLCGWGIKNYLS